MVTETIERLQKIKLKARLLPKNKSNFEGHVDVLDGLCKHKFNANVSGTKGLTNYATNMEEGMDTSEPYVPPQPQLPPNTKTGRTTIAERPPAVVNQVPAVEHEQLRGVGRETPGVTVEGARAAAPTAVAVSRVKYPFETSTQQGNQSSSQTYV